LDNKNIKVVGKKIGKMVMVYIIILVEQFIEDNGKTENIMVKVYMNFQMVASIKVNGKII